MRNEPLNPLEFRPRAPGYWIRRYLPDKEAFVLAPADGKGSEFVATIDSESPARGRIREVIMESLFGHRQGLAPLRLLVRPRLVRPGRPLGGGDHSAEPFAAITDAFQIPWVRDSEARNILGVDGQVISRWSEGLADAVDHHGRIFLARRALEFFSGINAKTYGTIRERAAASLGVSGEILPKEVHAALRGAGEGRRCRYNPVLPLDLQVTEAPTPLQRANFSLQRAIVETFAHEAVVGLSALGDAQEELLSSGALLAVHPARKAELMRERTQETARGIASLMLAGLMELHGAEPASKECDELYGLLPDGSLARRPGLHEEVLREMAPHPVARSDDAGRKMAAYLEMALSRLARYEAEARGLVGAEQAKTAVGAKPRPSVPSEGEVAPGDQETALGIDRLIALGGHAATAADHAHKLVTQAETLPWI